MTAGKPDTSFLRYILYLQHTAFTNNGSKVQNKFIQFDYRIYKNLNTKNHYQIGQTISYNNVNFMFSLTVKLINRSRDFFFKTNFCKNFLFLSFTILATKSTQKACTVSLHFVLNNFMEQPLTANCQDSVCDFFKLLHHQHQQQRCCHGNASDDITDDKKQVRKYYRSGTGGRLCRCRVCTHQAAALFCAK